MFIGWPLNDFFVIEKLPSTMFSFYIINSPMELTAFSDYDWGGVYFNLSTLIFLIEDLFLLLLYNIVICNCLIFS